MTNAVVVFTARSTQNILNEGGTSAWRLDRNHALRCGFVVCARNGNARWVEGKEAHHSAFLVGKIKDVVPTAEYPGRFLIQLSEYALVNIPDVWKGERNPVKYSTLEDLGIEAATLTWKPMPKPTEVLGTGNASGRTPLTIDEAKQGLAFKFSVPVEAIEITIRG